MAPDEFKAFHQVPLLKIVMKLGILRGVATYWRMNDPGSALIRRMWLRAIKLRAEAASDAKPASGTLAHAPAPKINHDIGLRRQYLVGRGVDSTMEDALYRQILKFRQMPRGLFVGSPERVGALLEAIAATGN
ncbi:MAG: hypothetical protein NTW28_19775 [Candidatus Solibacter sp.]|nr:hypothetical protein [Candidatus Solibacter sp.]